MYSVNAIVNCNLPRRYCQKKPNVELGTILLSTKGTLDKGMKILSWMLLYSLMEGHRDPKYQLIPYHDYMGREILW